MTDNKRHSHSVLLRGVRAMMREAGFDVRERQPTEPRAINFVVNPNDQFKNGFSVIVRTQNVSGSTERKAKDLRDALNTGELGPRPVVFVIDGHRSDNIRETLQQCTLSKCLGVFTIRDLLLWLLNAGKQMPRQAKMF